MSLWTTLARLARDPRDAEAALQLGRELVRVAEETRLPADERADSIAALSLKFLERAQAVLSSVAAEHEDLAAARADDPDVVVREGLPAEVLRSADGWLGRYAGRSLHNLKRDVARRARAQQRSRTRVQEEQKEAEEKATRRREIAEVFESFRGWVRDERHLFRDMQIDIMRTLEELGQLAWHEVSMHDVVMRHVEKGDGPGSPAYVRARDALYQRHRRLRKVLREILGLKERRNEITADEAVTHRGVLEAVLRRRRAP